MRNIANDASMTAQMATSKQAITSLLTEHFRYTPLTLLDDIINTVNELVYRAVTAVEQGLTNAPAESLGFADRAIAEKRIPEKDEDGGNLYPESRSEIEHGVHQLETLLEDSVDKNFDKLEIFVLRSILNVPEELAPWIRLSHYENLDFSAAASNISPEALYQLRRRVYETRKLNNSLLKERDRNASLLTDLKRLLQPADDKSVPDESLAFLAPNHAALGLAPYEASNGHPVTSSARFSVSQLPALRQMVNELRHKVGTMSVPKVNAAAEERRDHIEGETRRRLEKDGVDVQSGEGLVGRGGSGTRVGLDDIRGIETVVSILEGSGMVTQGGRDDPMEQ